MALRCEAPSRNLRMRGSTASKSRDEPTLHLPPYEVGHVASLMLLDNRWIEQPRDLANSQAFGDTTRLFYVSSTTSLLNIACLPIYSLSRAAVWESGQPIRARPTA